ncbi:DUF6221 family protein [Streptomyces sp. N2-109]|uniref:DUF6221 family protein n=1 Tax=Streptomyces gossypii TaxID=2883101 RepID=A0ABT2JTC6_9ACTN|nr:DUF6221 family protein [Streptomyces gossypii]MCT2591120.1 DUF6221 family protein [Streptomyces gossypii]
MTADLTAFLRARLDEDEAVARKAKPGPWRADGGSVYAAHPTDEVVDYARDNSAPHIARHGPARVLREVEAKKRMVTAYEYALEMKTANAANYQAWVNNDAPPYPEAAEGTDEQRREIPGLAHALRLLTLPYADHPDYREEWLP